MLESNQLEKTEPFPSREVQESLLNCVEEGTKMVTSLVDGSLFEGQSRSFYNPSRRFKLKSFEDMTHKTTNCAIFRKTLTTVPTNDFLTTCKH
jgi:hypothetical protein